MFLTNDQLQHQNIKTRQIYHGLAGVAMSLGCMFAPGDLPKVASGIGAVGNFLYVNILERKKQPLLEQLRDLDNIDQNSRKQKALLSSHDFSLVGAPQAVEETPKEAPLDYSIFDINRFKTDSVHIAIFASSGSGKSFFLRWLMGYIFHDQQYCLIDPHADKGYAIDSKEHALNLLEDFAHGKIKRLIVGAGRDFVSIANFYLALEDHVTWRFQNGGESANFPVLNLIVEELPAVVKNTSAIDKDYKDLVPSTNQTLLTESRKVGIRIVAITQGDQVNLLGLKGMSSLKSAYRFVRLGKEAIRHAGTKGLSQLEEKLTEDFHKSLAIHRKSKSKAMFKGTCFMVDDSEYMPFRDLSIWGMDALESDLYDVYETQPETVNATDHPDHPRSTEHAVSQAETPHIVGIDVDRDLSPEGLESPDSNGGQDIAIPSPDFPSYHRHVTKRDNRDQSGATFPVSKMDGSKTVVIQNLDDFWVAKYKAHGNHAALENTRPDYLKDHHIEKYFKLRGDGATPSKAAKTLFGGAKYSRANLWLKEVHKLLGEC